MHGRTLSIAALALLLVATAADAATVTADRRCYVAGDPVKVRAEGFAPQTPLTVTLDGRVQRYRDGSLPVTDEAGAFGSSLAAPQVLDPHPERRIAVEATDGAARARTRFTVTRPMGADFAPARGNPKRLKVRFEVWGFAAASGRNARTYLHWIDPHGRVRANAPLGRTRGPCGYLRTPRRRVFPFPADNGRWVLVFDTHARYAAGAAGPHARIRVHVRPVEL